jgi:hypothetical protein
MRAAMLILAVLFLAAHAELASAQPGGGPCAQIRAICEQAGFLTGGGRKGVGLMSDCIRPLMQGGYQPRRSAQPLPTVDPQIVAACKTQNPSFGVVRKTTSQARARPATAHPDEGTLPANSGDVPPADQPAAPAK